MTGGSRPNVIAIMADDLGFGDLGYFTNGSVETPHIDSLARDGMVLTQHYSASPICAPARAAFLTGRYPHRTGVIDTFHLRGLDSLAERETTLAEELRSAGYHTGLVGKWHNGAIGDETHPNRRGFVDFIGFRGGAQDYWDWHLERNGVPFSSDGRYITDVFTDEAVSFLQRCDDPFFLKVAYTAPHGPFQAPDAELESVRKRRGVGGEIVDTIAAMVQVLDRGIGRILSELEATGRSENTLVLFTSDNGPWMRPGDLDFTTVRYNLGLAGGKEHVLEGGIRVPALVRWPDVIPRGSTTHEVVHFVDWAPTIRSACGLDAATLPTDGRDVSRVLAGEPAASVPERFWQWSRYSPQVSVNSAFRDGPWKLMYPINERGLLILESDRMEGVRWRSNPSGYTPPESGFEEPPPYPDTEASPKLFNVLADPGETLDLADQHPERVQAMDARLRSWFDEVESERASITTTRPE